MIDENHFFDVRIHTPKKGQVMARYRAVAYFTKGPEKYQIIDLLSQTDKVIPTTQVMRKLLFTTEPDSYRVPKQMLEDLLSGMTREEVAEKEYKYTLEMFFYTDPDRVPDDPHWDTISLLNLEDFVSKTEQINQESQHASDPELGTQKESDSSGENSL